MLQVRIDIFGKTASLANSSNLNGSLRLILFLAHWVYRSALLSSELWVAFRSFLHVFSFHDLGSGSRHYLVLSISTADVRAQRGQSQTMHSHLFESGLYQVSHIPLFKGSLMAESEVSRTRQEILATWGSALQLIFVAASFAGLASCGTWSP